MLKFYSQNFNTVEVNNTFYNLPKKQVVKNWRDATPAGFIFSIKANRYITHMKNLKDGKEPVRNLIKSVRVLKDQLGPILFQLPPQWTLNYNRIESFINILPEDLQYVFEFRNSSWYVEKVYNLLRKHNIAICFHDISGQDSPHEITSDFLYLRFHGPHGDYHNKYSHTHLKTWGKKIRLWLDKQFRVFAYFNNDAYGRAIENSKELRTILKKNIK